MIEKSTGVTETERMLAKFCERSFLKLWSYPNPYKNDGHELCDLIAVFGNLIFIFFDRENILSKESDKNHQVLWERWKKNVVDRQINTANGAERYIRRQQPIFVDSKRTIPFPLEINLHNAIFYKIIVAHGAKEACLQSSDQNVYGSLAITYGEMHDNQIITPFHIKLCKKNPVHIFDSHNLSIILSELDTVTDFSRYLDAKRRAIEKFDFLSYCGEEDLLGHYLTNYDKETKQHIIGVKHDNVNCIMIGEGEWRDFISTDIYKNTKNENRISYEWDKLISRTCQNALNGTLGGNSDLLSEQSAIFEMVKEPRFMRRALMNKIEQAIINFPDNSEQFTRQVIFIPSYFQNVGYVFLQLRVPSLYRQEPDYRDVRRAMLEIACGAAKNKFLGLVKVIGIGIDAPKFASSPDSEDFILLPCERWTDGMRKYYEKENQALNFFATPHMKEHKEHITQFVPPSNPTFKSNFKVGRNELCPCGGGKKYKRCCL